MCRCVTWAISCASTEATSDSLSAASIRPVCTPTKPPGSANALMVWSRMAKNSKSWRAPAAFCARRAPRVLEVVGDLRVVQVARLAEADVAHDAFADAPLDLRREPGVAAAAEIGQRLAERARRQKHGHQQQERGFPHVFMIAPAMRAKSLIPQSLTHFDAKGSAHMVDVGAKPSTHRLAIASGRIVMKPATLRLIAAGGAKKGDVLGVARIAAVQAAKRAAELIPLAHPIGLTRVSVDFELGQENGVGPHRGPRGVPRPDRGRDGGADRRGGRAAHHLRHGEGGRPRHDAERDPPRGKTRRKVRVFPPRGTIKCAP